MYCNLLDAWSRAFTHSSSPAASRIQVALNVAIPACALCVNRLLYRVARMNSVGTTDAENRRVVVIDLSLGVGIPVLQMIIRE